jgi:hypothetical protein
VSEKIIKQEFFPCVSFFLSKHPLRFAHTFVGDIVKKTMDSD